jgi:hypothetical protein
MGEEHRIVSGRRTRAFQQLEPTDVHRHRALWSPASYKLQAKVAEDAPFRIFLDFHSCPSILARSWPGSVPPLSACRTTINPRLFSALLDCSTARVRVPATRRSRSAWLLFLLSGPTTSRCRSLTFGHRGSCPMSASLHIELKVFNCRSDSQDSPCLGCLAACCWHLICLRRRVRTGMSNWRLIAQPETQLNGAGEIDSVLLRIDDASAR